MERRNLIELDFNTALKVQNEMKLKNKKSPDELLEELRKDLEPSLEHKLQKAQFDLSTLRKKNIEYLNENIELGEYVEKLKGQMEKFRVEYNKAFEAYKHFKLKYENEIEFDESNKKELKVKLKDMTRKYELSLKTIEDLKLKNIEIQNKLNQSGRPSLDKNLVKKIHELRGLGFSYQNIASRLNISKSVVSKYLNKNKRVMKEPSKPKTTMINFSFNAD